MLTVVFSFGIAQFSLAQNFGLEQSAGKANYDVSGKTNLYTLITTIVQGVLAALAIVFFVFITYAGILWMKARGNEASVTEAKDMIFSATIGLIIIMSAYGLTTYILGKLNG